MGKGKSYNKKILYNCILEIRPVNRIEWIRTLTKYQEETGESTIRDVATVKKYWINTMCNGGNIPTGGTQENKR